MCFNLSKCLKNNSYKEYEVIYGIINDKIKNGCFQEIMTKIYILNTILKN